MNKHSNYDLAQMQSLPLSAKIRMSEQRIREWYEYWNGDVYLAISGGKDSQVLAHICDNILPDIEKVFVNTGLEFNSVREKGIELSNTVLKPKMTIVETITKYGYPIISKSVSHSVGVAQRNPNGKLVKRYFSGELKGMRFDCSAYSYLINAPFRISDNCCNVFKKKPSHNFAKKNNKKAIVGTMAEESQIRYVDWLKNGCNSFSANIPVSKPLSFWSEQDILQYIKEYNLDIASVYGNIIEKNGTYSTTGEKRTGCVYCMYGMNKDTERFLRLKELEPMKYDYIMRGGKFDENGMWIPWFDENGKMGLGYKFVIDWLNEHSKLQIKY